ncbi:MAG: DsbA family oxidoreductase [Sphingomonadaceae bacterium]|nr:DsbA family oxidoreductase [Sphingomonadaceae bacterium]
MTRPAKVTIDIWSDVMCPWCIIGYSQLQKGLQSLAGEIEAEVRWHAFQLNPDMPEEGEEQQAHLARKYGRSPDQMAAARGQMKEIAARAGYSFDYTGGAEQPEARLWNTLRAHKLLLWTLAQHGPEKQTELKLALFGAHFQQRRNVSDPAVLIKIAESVGIERAGAEAALDSAVLAQQALEEQRMAYDMNVTGVPAMLINGKFMVPGSQEPETYANALRRVVAREAEMAARAG